ncbi:RNA-directed DNA polymerase, eukaryota [Tanacetum coccineum]
MGSFRSKEDDVAKISTSIFVSNFPDSVSAKDLFHSCKQYGHVVDSFIPMKRLKDGKRFGFVRFINVFNVERLVNNLCTIWLNRCKLHANIARRLSEFQGFINSLIGRVKDVGSIDLFSVRLCWGNVNFDYVHSDSIGNSGGILCIWDPNSFRKDSVTVSDYFVIVRGVWIKSGMDILIAVVYAPHDVRDKRLLWDYLSHVSNQWAGEVVMMGDFNEVRYKSDRFGSNFNAHDADIFNNFIINAGLEEVPLGGSAYTWCHKFASKMSKLDRFLVSEIFLNTCPNISAITLDRFLSDHRLILLREASFDYGPSVFSLLLLGMIQMLCVTCVVS